jgi:drug/metabolite transporter (DMT)-like permease
MICLRFSTPACQRRRGGSNEPGANLEIPINRPAPDERLAVLCGIGAVLLWSTVATGFKLGLRVLAPLELLWFGAATSFVFFAIASAVSGRIAALTRLSWRDWLRLGSLGLLNPFLYYLVLFEAYDRLPAQIAQPLNYTWAITLALLAIPLLGQRMTWRMAAGMLVSYGGVVILLSQGRSDGFAQIDRIGVALALGSTLIWATYWLATVRASDDPLVMMTASFAVGATAIGITCYAIHGLPALTLPRLGYGAWVGLVEMGVTFLLWQQALRRTAHAGRIAQLIFLSPFISLVLIDRVLGEHVHAASFIGLAAIICGLLLAGRVRPA